MNNEKIKNLENRIENTHGNITGVVVLKNDEVKYEKYFNNCTDVSRVHVYSVAKSIISILMGIAMDKGYINCVDQKVLDFFPDYAAKKGEKTKQNITLKNLLTMTAPYKYKFAPYTYFKYFMCNDWLKFTLDLLGGKEEIGNFNYTPVVGPDILSGILMKATGQSVLNFAKNNLFLPLGITVEENIILHTAKKQSAFNKATDISGWVCDACGLNSAGWGLTMSALDLAKIGKLLLNKGIWNGKQIVSSQWIEESIKEHSRWEKENLSYGYLWWIEENIFAAMGDGGNVLYINRKKNIVISITALFKPNVTDRIELIKEYIEPIFENEM